MKKLTALVLSCFICMAFTKAQNATIKGVVTDTLNKENLFNSAVTVIRAKDSVLVKFSRSDKQGKFQISGVPAGKYIMMITYPSFADYYETIDLSGKPEVDMGLVKMTLKSKLLEDVVVRSRIAAIRMKGDTIEYKADSFKVSPGASVEEMLRKLPGLQVDKDGNITAQGEKIEKVLVDGEEFFGDDPTMATKNLQADAVDKVQVFDKKSDQSTFTGIDDGQKSKTLNLTLKEDRKKGYFGKVELKGGLNDRWSNTFMGNAFKGKRKLSAYGIMSSTGATGLNWNDRRTYGDGGGMEYNADEGYFTGGGGDEFDGNNGNYNGVGIPKSWGTAVNYGNKYNKDQQIVNGSYRYNKIITEGSGKTFTQSILPTTVLYNNETNSQYNNRQRHSANGTYEWMIDSFTSIKVVARGTKGTSINNSIYSSEVRDSINTMVNASIRNSFGESENETFNSNFIVRRRFKKVGRTISLSFDQQYRNNSGEGVLFSIADFYEKGNLRRKDTTDQNKINNNSLTAYNTRLAYTEPILKNTFLELSYALRLTQSESERLSYNKSAAGKYEMLDPRFSNHYDFKVLTNTGGMMLRYNTKKYNISGGGDVGRSNFTQSDLIRDTAKNYSFTNLFPRANLQYKFNATTSLSLNYNGSTRQPTIEQLQPVRDNSNVTNIAVGNPDLKQEFRHSFRLGYTFYKVLSQRSLYTSASFNTVSNAITTNETVSTSVDSAGFRTYQFINVNGNYSGSLYGGYNFKITKLDLRMNFGFDMNVNHRNNVINKQKNASDNTSYGVNFGIDKFKEKKYNVYYYSNFSYNHSVSSVRNNLKTQYYTHNHNLFLNITLAKKFEFNSSINANFRQRLTAADENNNVVLWNGYFGRKLFKNDKGMIRIEANDILNQNKGFSRYITDNNIRENTYETLQRYFLLAFVWNFSKTPPGMGPPTR